MTGTKLVADGQLFIGSTAAPFTNVGTLASADGSVTITNGAGTIDLSSGAGLSSLKNIPEWFDDFVYGSTGYTGELGWIQLNASTVGVSGEDGHPGIVNLDVSAVSYNGLSAYSGVCFGTDTYVYETVLKLSVLSDNDDNYQVSIGISDAAGLPIQNQVAFIYNNTINTGNWTGRISVAGVDTDIDTGIAVTTDWVSLKIDISTGAAEFFVDGVSGGTITTALPTVSLPFNYNIEKLIDTNAETELIIIDAFYAKCTLTTPRFL